MKAKSPNSIDVYVGNRVRVRRKTLGMTQHGLAELLGITFQQIQKYEKGTNRIGASRLQRISEILRVPVGFFFENGGGGPIEGETSELNKFLSSKEGLALINGTQVSTALALSGLFGAEDVFAAAFNGKRRIGRRGAQASEKLAASSSQTGASAEQTSRNSRLPRSKKV